MLVESRAAVVHGGFTKVAYDSGEVLVANRKTVDILNRLLGRHMHSLAVYLSSAPPWASPGDAQALTVLRQIADDQKLMGDRIATAVLDEGGRLQAGEFPMTYTDLHDVGIGYLVPQLVAAQRDDVAAIRVAVEQLRDAPLARAVAEEALGAAQGHLDSLLELPQAAIRA